MGVDDGTVPGNEHPVLTARGQYGLKRRRPSLQIGIGVDDRITGLFDKITAEHHRVLVRHRHDQVVGGVAGTGTADTYDSAAEIDITTGHLVRGNRQCRDRPVDVVSVGAVVDRIRPQVRSADRHGRRNLWCTVDFGLLEPGATQDMVEMVVRQDDTCDMLPRQRRDIGLDTAGLGQCRTGIDQKSVSVTADQTDRDIEKRKAGSPHTRTQLFPVVVHSPSPASRSTPAKLLLGVAWPQ